MSQLKAWSYSRIQIFESCKLHAKLKYIDKIPEPPRPLPPGKTEHANDRGTRVHEAAELYVRGGIELLPELGSFHLEFERLRAFFSDGRVSLEGEWAVDSNWSPCAWGSDSVWGRIKLDALVWLTPTEAVVIDYKTGKRHGNEIKHAEQAQLYQLATFMRYPEIEKITTELWYLDQDELVDMTYTKAQGLKFLKGINERGLALTNCTEFPPNPNIYSCRYCPYGPKGTGHCKVGV